MNDVSHLPRLISSDGQEFIVADKMVVGRLSECQLQVKDNLASRRHATLEFINQRVILTDLNSNNGTWVNNQRISKPVELHPGDRVKIGETVFTFKAGTPQPQRTAGQNPAAPNEEPSIRTMAWQTASLMALVRGNDGAEFGLTRSMRIGRDETNDLPLKGDPGASQFHAVIELVEGQVILSDLHSSNGTWVNGRRITGKTVLRHGDKIHLGKTIFRLRVGEHPLPPLDIASAPQKNSAWIGWATSAALIVIALIVVCVATIPAFLNYSSHDDTKPTPTSQAQAQQPPAIIAPAETTDTTNIKQEALRSLAMILVPDQNFKANGWGVGSGSFINSQGYILTNFHVIGYTESEAKRAGKRTGDMKNTLHDGEEFILAGVNWSNPLAKPDTFYRCEIVQSDPYLDLALLHVVQLYDFETDTLSALPADLSFPVIAIGNSDDLKILEPITIIGFPGVGGDTPTAIDDQVAGFSPDDDYNIENGWIKTGPVISHGNSGGMAINQKGELIGVPTAVIIFEADKIGYIRPINLALPIIQDFLP